ncbi:hypothetical protein [Anaeromyxobacter oryzae]|uniref:Uncharacterized protein n=1 Tax=Anaeromyxobacter oryzae TaxID=2918170 RepID=A0ABN6MLI2_9BACT|nr:hypothetical protein [Anaeromyxobacter oryzae]BDG01884.1 hypothetical protein AMOR_08800 [Anaeromyxobacter oryzae]
MVSLLVVGALAMLADAPTVDASQPAADAAVPAPPAAPLEATAAAAAPATPASAPLDPVADGQDGVVVLRDGRTVRGHVIVVAGGKVSVRDEAGKVHVLKLDEVLGLLHDVAKHGAVAAGDAPEVQVVLRDGSVVAGRVVERGPEGLVVENAGGRRALAETDVAQVIPMREEPRPFRPAPRHLAAPSGYLLRSGEVQLSAANVVDVSASAGIGDHVTVSVGSTIPALHAWAYGSNVQGSVRTGLALGDWVHVAGGVHGAWGEGSRTAAYLSATLTVGRPRAHLTVYAGPTFGGANRLANLGDVGVAVCGTVEVAHGISAVTESWFSRAAGETDALLALAGRYRLGRGALDAGIAYSVHRAEVLPWIGLAVDVTP